MLMTSFLMARFKPGREGGGFYIWIFLHPALLQNLSRADCESTVWSRLSAPTLRATSCPTCSRPITSSVCGGRRGRARSCCFSTSRPSGGSSTCGCSPTACWSLRTPWWSGTTSRRASGSRATSQRAATNQAPWRTG